MFVDLFSGCGGFSLGLANAGMRGIFAIEKDDMAFETLSHNLIYGERACFDWPDWLPVESLSMQDLLKKYRNNLKEISSNVSVLVGGPPCQGFSFAGKRNPDDPRNSLTELYISAVRILSPKILFIENVKGFASSFGEDDGSLPYSVYVRKKIERAGYKVFQGYVNCADFGVPQNRKRFLMIGVRRDVFTPSGYDAFSHLDNLRKRHIESKGLGRLPVTTKQAIGDLEVSKHRLIPYEFDEKFKRIDYRRPRSMNSFLKIVGDTEGGSCPNSLRLPRHKEETVRQFSVIQDVCRPGVVLSKEIRDQLGIKKYSICVLHPDKPAKTLTTLPDDLIHYSEPRILTVRECARLQSFPDSYEFRGKYTTGSFMRVQECPRYTQVGNAVPPMLSEVLGLLAIEILEGGKYEKEVI